MELIRHLPWKESLLAFSDSFMALNRPLGLATERVGSNSFRARCLLEPLLVSSISTLLSET